MNRILRFLSTSLLFFSVGIPPTADGETFRLQAKAVYDAEPVPAAEVCFYPYQFYEILNGVGAAAYRCLPAEKLIEVPPLSFAYFVRHESGLTSANPIVFSAPATGGFRAFRFSLGEGASLDFTHLRRSLAPNESLGIILGGSETSGPYGMPVARDIEIVPADVPVVPVLVRDRVAIRVGDVITPRPHSMHVVSEFPDESALLVRVVVADPSSRGVPELDGPLCDRPYSTEFATLVREQEPPVVEFIDAAGDIHEPVLEPPMAAQMLTGAYIFRGFASGEGRIRIRGGRWIRAEHTLTVNAGVTTMTERLPAVLGGSSLVVLDRPIEDLLAAAGRQCEDAPKNEQAQPAEIALFRCPKARVGQRLAGCSEWAKHQFVEARSYPFEGLEPGSYTVITRANGRTIAEATGEIALGETTTVALEEPAGFYVTGRVTIGAEPLEGTVQFRTGKAVSSASGDYAVLLSGPPRQAPVRFQDCDRSMLYLHHPEVAVASGSIVDIDIPTHSVVIDVRDAETGKRLPEAKAMVAVLVDRDDPDRVDYFSPAVPEDGELIARFIDEARPFRVCAQARGYGYHCQEEIRAKREGRERATVELEPVAERSGRVLTPGYRNLFWTTGNGAVTERVRIEEDGTFRYEKHHGPEEFVVLVGTAPLAMMPTPVATDGDPLEIRTNVPSVAKVVVRLSPTSTRRNALLALWVDGIRIPHDALVSHQIMRRERMFIIQREPVVIGQIGGTDLAVAAGPDPELLPPGTDLGALSLFIGVNPRPVTSGEVVFE